MSALSFLFSGREEVADEFDLDAAKLAALGSVYAVVELDPAGNFRAANDRFLAATGYSRAELMGQHHRALVPREMAHSAEYDTFWGDLRAGKGKAGEFKRVRRDGSPIWLRAAYCPIRGEDESVEGVIKLALDTTAERLALDRGQCVVEMGLDGTVLDANEGFLELVGYSLEELRGQHHRALVEVEFARSDEYAAHWNKLRRGEFVSGTFLRLGKGGRKIFMRASYNPVFDQDGQPVKIVKYANDVTVLRESVDDVLAVVEGLGQCTTSLAASNEQLGATATATLDKASSSRTRSDEISAAMQSVSAATEQLSSSVAEIAQTSASAAEEAKVGSGVATKASTSVGGLRSAGERISAVVGLIRDIADQTNLLALNATIEAASAGPAGRGFKVVADEVKALSNETARATQEISGQINEIKRIAEVATTSVEELSGIISGMADRQIALAATAEEQQAVTSEIASHASRVASTMAAATADVASLSASAEEAHGVAGDVGRAVRELGDVSDSLSTLMAQLREAQ